jgi:ABC-type multidrug transport system fused ATPase/permease subunit
LSNLSFKAEDNGLIGFVGQSGSGKSTIFSLLTNFYQKQSGEILINGVPFERLNEETVRGKITPVLQDPYIFNDTILNNVKLANPLATDEDVIAACRMAELHEEIMNMPNGYTTMIGENGSNLSGGQKQRVEIARALLKNSDVLLLDEATSALDKANLDKINNLLHKIKKDKIILVIAHRLGAMRQCDKVFLLEDGRFAGSGTHDELSQNNEYYQSLFKNQK